MKRCSAIQRLPAAACIAAAAAVATLGCSYDEEPDRSFVRAVRHERAALTAVHGISSDDVWLVGADGGNGATLLHWQGGAWNSVEAGIDGDLWWVQAVNENTLYVAGTDAGVFELRRGGDTSNETGAAPDGRDDEANATWTPRRLSTPGLGKHTVFGVWARGPDDLYAVGTAQGRNGFIWHDDGNGFVSVPLPAELAREDGDFPPLFKVAGGPSVSDDGSEGPDVWVVGGDGAVLRGNATAGFVLVESGTRERLFSVSVAGDGVMMVGGGGEGVVLYGGLEEGDELRDVTPEGAPLLQGAWLNGNGEAWVSGRAGALYHGPPDELREVDVELRAEAEPGAETGPSPEAEPGPAEEVEAAVESWHSVWEAPDGSVWAVGGDVLSGTLSSGHAIARGVAVAEFVAPPPDPEAPASCPDDAVDPAPEGSMARRWNEQILGAIRRDLPRPTVHARNLWHLSIAMWDAWAAYSSEHTGRVVSASAASDDVAAARATAIAHAAHGVLSARYRDAVGGNVSVACFDAFLQHLGLARTDDGTTADDDRALGQRIARDVLAAFADDGSNEPSDYADPDGFRSEQPVLIVDEPGVFTSDPARWQQLLLAEAVTQNGIAEGAGVRDYVGAHWGQVAPFALRRSEASAPYFAPDAPPLTLTDDVVDAAVEVLEWTAELDLKDAVLLDISPASTGNHSLGRNDGTGHDENPVTQAPYEPQWVPRGDFTRVMAEFWADGPDSETPPGHWNTLANQVADHPAHERRLFGAGPVLDPLAWDVHVYFALNGALHDAAIAAWEQKRAYLSARPITLIRYLAGRGQRSDLDGPSYDPEGIPLMEGLIEVITEASSAKGERHEHLARYLGEIAVHSWRGEPGDRTTEIGGFDWIRAADWIPYQRRTFVTPAFPGYVSGHSTFSRAAARVLTDLTGSAYFPGGLGEYPIERGYLVFEAGPSEPLVLQWATYFDASDQAGQSRLWGGIHIRHDDWDGRVIGEAVGKQAIEEARRHFAP